MNRIAGEEAEMDGVDRRSQEPTGDDQPIGRLPDALADRLRGRDQDPVGSEEHPTRAEEVDDAIADALGDDPADDPA